MATLAQDGGNVTVIHSRVISGVYNYFYINSTADVYRKIGDAGVLPAFSLPHLGNTASQVRAIHVDTEFCSFHQLVDGGGDQYNEATIQLLDGTIVSSSIIEPATQPDFAYAKPMAITYSSVLDRYDFITTTKYTSMGQTYTRLAHKAYNRGTDTWTAYAAIIPDVEQAGITGSMYFFTTNDGRQLVLRTSSTPPILLINLDTDLSYQYTISRQPCLNAWNGGVVDITSGSYTGTYVMSVNGDYIYKYTVGSSTISSANIAKAPLLPSGTRQVLSAGLRLSSDETEIYYNCVNRDSNDGKEYSTRVVLPLVDILTNAGSAITTDTELVGFTPDGAPYTLRVGAYALPAAAEDADILYFFRTSSALYYDTWISGSAGATLSLSVDLTLGGIVPSVEIEVVVPVPIYELVSWFQLAHSLEAYLFNPDELAYLLTLADSSLIPMINFTLERSARNLVIGDYLRISVPKYFQSQIINLIGTSLTISRNVNGNSQELATGLVTGVDVRQLDRATITAENLESASLGGKSVTAKNLMYTNIIRGIKKIRTEPNTSIYIGDTVTYNNYSAILAGKVVTYISKDSKFTEVTE